MNRSSYLSSNVRNIENEFLLYKFGERLRLFAVQWNRRPAFLMELEATDLAPKSLQPNRLRTAIAIRNSEIRFPNESMIDISERRHTRRNPNFITVQLSNIGLPIDYGAEK